MKNNPLIAYHAKNDKHGWTEVCRHRLDSPEWSTHDRMWIDELIQQNEWVLTCGWNMWQIVKEN